TDGDPLTAILVTGPEHGTLTLNSDGSFTYSPEDNWNGSDSFTYKANDGATDSNPAAVTLTVNPVNDAPVAADDTASTNEDTQVDIPVSTLLVNDSDVDGDALSLVEINNVTSGTVALVGETITFTPTTNFHGEAGFDYTITDDTTLDTAHVTIMVTPLNDPPTASNDSYSTNEDTPLTVATPGVLENDTDADGDLLNAILVTGPQHGTLTLNPDGSFTYSPDIDWSGIDSFRYKSNDGLEDSNTATVTITVVSAIEWKFIYLPLVFK
ncbi:MAG TPA: cadherin-like domain-containing protein, partial [Anaerolineaceae bacterium]|nr:cadherin-like domain-containing protein [Anaerolineaceae bacterium]